MKNLPTKIYLQLGDLSESELEAISKEILYKPVTNGKSEQSIKEGAKLIKDYIDKKALSKYGIEQQRDMLEAFADYLNKEFPKTIDLDCDDVAHFIDRFTFS